MSRTLELAKQLIANSSVTPRDEGCQDLMIRHLEAVGFRSERFPFGEVDNVWIRHGSQPPLLVFAGHTDVVPPGDLRLWHSPPFAPQARGGYLYGRGAADMKGSLAAMVVACERFVVAHPEHAGSLALLVTSDEEGDAVDGTVKVLEELAKRGENIDWCLVGEPSSHERLGDVIKNGRRGSLSGHLCIHGQQGHVAYPHLADNPIHRFAPVLAELAMVEWDQGNDHFPPTTFQISNITAGTGASNVIPRELQVMFNFRYSTESDYTTLKQRVHALLDRFSLQYELEWSLSGEPFLTMQGELLSACRSAIREVTGLETTLSTAGGTSDGRFVAKTGSQVVELGPVNATIHQINECVKVEDLDVLGEIYLRTLNSLLLERNR